MTFIKLLSANWNNWAIQGNYEQIWSSFHVTSTVLGIGWPKSIKKQILPSKPTISRQCQWLFLLEKAKSYSSASCLATTIPSYFLCCCLVVVPGTFMPGLLRPFPNDPLFTLLSSPWLTFNLASWSMVCVVTTSIFLKCDCNPFTSNLKAISDNPTFYFNKVSSAFPTLSLLFLTNAAFLSDGSYSSVSEYASCISIAAFLLSVVPPTSFSLIYLLWMPWG